MINCIIHLPECDLSVAGIIIPGIGNRWIHLCCEAQGSVCIKYAAVCP